jgi:CHAD domain-containing protein
MLVTPSADLFAEAPIRRYLARLRPVQDALGTCNDLVVADGLLRPQVASDPHAWFALGWIAARRAAMLDEAAAALSRLRKAPRLKGRH